MNTKQTDILNQNKIFAWIAVATGVILLIPLLAMQFTHEVRWDMSDFIIMGAMLFGTGSLFVLVARKIGGKYRALIGLAFLLVFLWLWAELAVGVFTSWGS